MSNIASRDFAHVALTKISRWTVCRAEVLAAAGMQAAHRHRMLACDADVADVLGPSALAVAQASDQRLVVAWSGLAVFADVQLDSVRNFRFACVSYRGDGTNAGCWRGNKLHATMVEKAQFIGQSMLGEQSTMQGMV